MVLAGWIIYAESLNLMAWHFVQQLAGGSPGLSLVPRELPVKSTATLDGRRVEKFGYSLQVPWKEVNSDRTFNNVALLSFKEGVSLLLMNPKDAVDTLRTMNEGARASHSSLQDIVGASAARSNYELMNAGLQEIPSDAKWWISPKHNARCVALLTIKSACVFQTSVIYRINIGEIRGFQFGNPSLSPYRVRLKLFDRNDHLHEIWISSQAKRPALAQAELNAFIASIKQLN